MCGLWPHGSPDAGGSYPEIIAEFDASLRNAALLGLGALTEDMEMLFHDWRDLVMTHDAPVQLIHGTADMVNPITAIEALAVEMPERYRIVPVQGSGYFLLETRPDVVMAHLAGLSA